MSGRQLAALSSMVKSAFCCHHWLGLNIPCFSSCLGSICFTVRIFGASELSLGFNFSFLGKKRFIWNILQLSIWNSIWNSPLWVSNLRISNFIWMLSYDFKKKAAYYFALFLHEWLILKYPAAVGPSKCFNVPFWTPFRIFISRHC